MALPALNLINKDELTKLVKLPKEKLEKCFDRNGHTPLTYCCKNRKLDALYALLQNGVNPDELDDTGKCGLHHAIMDGYEDVVHILVNNNARLNNTCSYKNTLLHYAVLNRRLSLVKYILDLLGSSPQINFENMSGKTPLGIARENGYDDIVNLLTKVKSTENEYVSVYENDNGSEEVLSKLIARIVSLEDERNKQGKQIKYLQEIVDKVYNQTANIRRSPDQVPPRPPRAVGSSPEPYRPVPVIDISKGHTSCPENGSYCDDRHVYTNLVKSTMKAAVEDDYLNPTGSDMRNLNTAQTSSQPASDDDKLSKEEQEHLGAKYEQFLQDVKLTAKVKAKLFTKRLLSTECMQKEKDDVIEHIFFERLLSVDGTKHTLKVLKETLKSDGQEEVARLLD